MRKAGLLFSLLGLLLTLQLHAQEDVAHAFNYLFPMPGAQYVHPGSSIILRFNNLSPQELKDLQSLIQVAGAKSGTHAGLTIIASDEQTVIYTPEEPYIPGEKVTVTIVPGLPESHPRYMGPLVYEFSVLEGAPGDRLSSEEIASGLPGQKKNSESSKSMIMSNGVSVPADFPHVIISKNNNPSSDYVFINTWDPPYYSIIFDTSGDPLLYWKTADRRNDFKVQTNGWITMMVEDGYGGSGTAFIALDQDFQYIKSMLATNGYTTDEHDFYMLPDSGYILIGQRETMVDMSLYVEGGKTDAIVRETCIQEFTADDELIFIWRSWDHFDIRDLELESLSGSYIRFPHINAIFTDDDGHILISSRHLSEISKIHRQTGEFIWRMSGIPGSPNNDFLFERDPLEGFRNQHAIRALGDNTYALFDNGNMHEPPLSRALEYEIDTVLMTATLVWEHRSEYERSFVGFLGNTQRLSNGNTHVNWAYGNVLPIAAEVSPQDDIAFEMWFEQGDRCYRSYRHPWKGTCQTPYLLLEPQSDGLILIFNKFGDKNVDYYKIYGGTSPHPTSLIDTSSTTLKHLSDLLYNTRYYFRVTAIDTDGSESEYSNEEDVLLRDMEPGTNLIINGDFSHGLDEWLWEVDSTATAEIFVLDSVLHFEIQDGGGAYRDVQLSQDNIPLIRGQKYLLEFDARVNEIRIVEVLLEADHPPYTDYSQLGYTALDPASEKYSYSFVMNESTDLLARVVLNAGNSTEDIQIDNMSLLIDAPSNTSEQNQSHSSFLLYPNYPNPASSSTIIGYELPEASKVRLSICNSMGQKLAEFINREQMAGTYSVELQLGNYPSGVYYYILEARGLNSAHSYRLTRRMVILK